MQTAKVWALAAWSWLTALPAWAQGFLVGAVAMAVLIWVL